MKNIKKVSEETIKDLKYKADLYDKILKDLKIKVGLHANTPDEVIDNCREAYNEFVSCYDFDMDTVGTFHDTVCTIQGVDKRDQYDEQFDTNAEYLQAWINDHPFIDDDHHRVAQVFGYWVKDRNYRKKYIKTLKKALNLDPNTPENVIDNARDEYRSQNGFTEYYSNEDFLEWMLNCEYKEWCEKWSKYCGDWYKVK